MAAASPTICVMDEVIKHVVATHNNKVSHQLLRGLFKTVVIGLQCMDTNTNTEVFK
jgi:hypothetical protein